ncbi:MAG: hypothetical protein ACXVZU_04120 [Methanobacteriaceae archaeon]
MHPMGAGKCVSRMKATLMNQFPQPGPPYLVQQGPSICIPRKVDDEGYPFEEEALRKPSASNY